MGRTLQTSNTRRGRLIGALVATIALLSLGAIFSPHVTPNSLLYPSSELSHASNSDKDSYLHYLIPATSSNKNFCRLLLSGAVLEFPTPVFINWAAHEAKDAYKQHLAKVETVLAYLDTIEPKTEHDLVLMVDGYDVWYQLRPDVLLKRYYAVNEEADRTARETYGVELFKQHKIKQTVLFGPDKICWPKDYTRPGCWTMPKGTLSDYAMGPDTDRQLEEHNRPRWLNSGTILGPIEDVREVFRATLRHIQNNHTTDSDQFYFAEVYGEQEFGRLALVPELLANKTEEVFEADYPKTAVSPPRKLHELPEGQKTEYHIGLDFSSDLFQTMAFFHQLLVWLQYSDMWKPSSQQQQALGPKSAQFSFDLPRDVQESAPPFEALGQAAEEAHDTSMLNQTWYDTHLLVNSITKKPPVTLHFTGPKHLRDVWWEKMWYFPQAETLRKAMFKVPRRPFSETLIGGRRWWGAEVGPAEDRQPVEPGAGFSDKMEYLSWDSLCHKHEKDVYRWEKAPAHDESKAA